MKYRPTRGVGRGQHCVSVLSVAWFRYSTKAILKNYELFDNADILY